MPRKLRALRKAAGLTLPQLGEKFGIAGSTIGNFETGRTEMSDEALKSIADYFNTSPSELKSFDASSGILRETAASYRPNPLAYCTTVWLKGEKIAEYKKVKTGKPIPGDWDSI